MTTNTDFPFYGTVSHGTMRDEDLIPTFLDVLDSLDAAAAADFRASHAGVLADLEAGEDPVDDGCGDFDNALGDMTHSLFDLLDERAPVGFYFGAIEGDGSDYGFWAVEDSP